MSDDDIDFNRVVSDPAYRRAVIEWLNTETGPADDDDGGRQGQAVRSLAPAAQDNR